MPVTLSAAHYRELAVQARQLAELATDPTVKRELHLQAASFLALAAETEHEAL